MPQKRAVSMPTWRPAVYLCALAFTAAVGSVWAQSSPVGESVSANTPVRYVSYAGMVERMRALAAKAPDLVELWSAQDRFQVASPGSCGQEACKHWFVTLTNKTSHQAAKPQPTGVAGVLDDNKVFPATLPPSKRPQIFLSGNLHGDEVVGPMTLIHLLEDLVAARLRGNNPWLNHLVDERVIVAIPMTNPIGYHGRVREENGMDPNRDFPYSIADPKRCMRTTTARAVNEAWRSYLFTLAVTFHGGMQSISYEWGAPNHSDAESRSPDDISQRIVGLVMRETAGAFQGSKYPVDRTNRLVYPVDGGMEDWAYAGSWEPDRSKVQPCTPTTYGGYPREKTIYNEAVLRALNMLVEAADDKTPAENALGVHGDPFSDVTWAMPDGAAATTSAAGTLAAVLSVEGPGDGHVPRNIRLALSVVDMASPYLITTRWRMEVGKKQKQGESGASATGRVLLSTEAESAAATAYNGPRGCYYQPSTASGDTTTPACLRWKDEYDSWHGQLEASVASDFVVSAEIGWDVGGGLNVDATGLLTGSWDARVPPSLLTEGALVGSADTIDVSPASVPAAFIALLKEHYGFDNEQEAMRFGRYVRAWQLVLLGKMEVEQMPSELLLYQSQPVKNTQTRWSFPNGAEGVSTSSEQQVMLQSLQPAEVEGAMVKGLVQQQQAGQRELTAAASLVNPLTSVSGAPDLLRHPFVTRYSQCFSAAGPAPYGKPLPEAPSSCSSATSTGGTTGSSNGNRGLLRGQEDRKLTATNMYGVQAYFSLSYAVVDKQWGTTGGAPVSPSNQNAPQGHLANARTNPAWKYENNGYKIEGRKLFVSRPKFFAIAGPVASVSGGASSGTTTDPSSSPASTAARPSCADSATAGSTTIDTSEHPMGDATSKTTDNTGTDTTNVIKVAGMEVSYSSLVAYSTVVTLLLVASLVVAIYALRQYYRSHRVAGFAPLPLDVFNGGSDDHQRVVVAGSGAATTAIADVFDDSDFSDDNGDNDESDKAKLRRPAAGTTTTTNNKTITSGVVKGDKASGSSCSSGGGGAGARPIKKKKLTPPAAATAPSSLAFDSGDDED